MPDVTYYFDSDGGDSLWGNPDSFNDGSIETFADTIVALLHPFISNTCPGTNLGTITKVELRVYGYGDGDDRIDLTPVFVAGDGDTHQTTPVVSPGDWSAYIDITTDTNAPSPWTWDAVQGLDCDAYKFPVSKINYTYGAKVEIRVTYEEVAPPEVGLENKSANMAAKMVAAGLI